jgi:hypothetical protein
MVIYSMFSRQLQSPGVHFERDPRRMRRFVYHQANDVRGAGRTEVTVPLEIKPR